VRGQRAGAHEGQQHASTDHDGQEDRFHRARLLAAGELELPDGLAAQPVGEQRAAEDEHR
jgi:hypothetical protein